MVQAQPDRSPGLLERYPSADDLPAADLPAADLDDDERLAQLLGPARTLLAQTDVLALNTHRAISRRLLSAVFCLCVGLGMAALFPWAAGDSRIVIVLAAAVFLLTAGLLGYGAAVLRFDLAPLNALGQELRAGLRSAEHSIFETPEEP
jgi:hypothetical protein